MRVKITRENIENYQYDKEVFYYDFQNKTLLVDLNQGQQLSGILIENVIYINQFIKIIESISFKKIKLVHL